MRKKGLLMKLLRQKTKYTIGTDPELFLMRDNAFVSAHDILPGDKTCPFPVPGGAIQVDGTAAEFNTNPAKTPEEFSGNITEVLKGLRGILLEKDSSLKMVVAPVAVFDREYFESLPGSAKLFGCSPDFNAWTQEENTPPQTTEPFRTGAGHIHMGWTQDESVIDPGHVFDCREMTQQLDASLYMMSLLWDKDEKRRTLYGKIGAHRVKEYGVEYRSLSNAFIADPDLHKYVFKTAVKAGHMLDAHRLLFETNFGKNLLHIVRKETRPARDLLLRYHDYLVNVWQFPALPEYYLGAGK